MLLVIAGIIIGWLLTNIAQGALAGRFYWRFDGVIYKDITERRERCVHVLASEQQLNGVHIGPCAYCTAVFVRVSDLQKVNYEQ